MSKLKSNIKSFQKCPYTSPFHIRRFKLVQIAMVMVNYEQTTSIVNNDIQMFFCGFCINVSTISKVITYGECRRYLFRINVFALLNFHHSFLADTIYHMYNIFKQLDSGPGIRRGNRNVTGN
jgi:hypothetical protein